MVGAILDRDAAWSRRTWIVKSSFSSVIGPRRSQLCVDFACTLPIAGQGPNLDYNHSMPGFRQDGWKVFEASPIIECPKKGLAPTSEARNYRYHCQILQILVDGTD